MTTTIYIYLHLFSNSFIYWNVNKKKLKNDKKKMTQKK